MNETLKSGSKLTFVALALTLSLSAATPTQISPQRYLDDVKFLASDTMKGRATGSPELEKAAKYIATEFHKIGLKPLDSKAYFQNFTVSINAHLGPDNKLTYVLNGAPHALAANDDFLPFNFSSSGTVSAPVVFAGYGITAKEYGYDDYAEIDAKDKIVLVLRHEPQEFDAKSVFNGRTYTEHSQLLSKATN